MTRLLLDVMLGKLATYLRMCGYDTAYALDRDVEADDALLAWAEAEGRTLLTRDEQLAAQAPDGRVVASTEVEGQLRELQDGGFSLSLPAEPQRCANCNGQLAQVSETDARPAHVPDASERPVWRCQDCGQYFWRGSHWDDVAATLASLE